MKVAFYTLGCKVNQNETGALTRMFCENGFTLAGEDEHADVYVVNSCTVTAGGDKKSRQWLRRAKRANPGAVTVLTGCFPQAFPEDAIAFEEADVITGSSARGHILDHVLQSLQTGERIIDIVPHARGEHFEELPPEQLTDRNRAFMKIEDGCDRRCAYCVIPRARGPVRSRSIDSILEELRTQAAQGVAEVVFSGINLSSYGKDNGLRLPDVVEQAAQVEGIQRIRLGSLEPDLLTEEDVARLAAVEKLCPQFHLALQSGCDATLRRMRRTYTTQGYRQVVRTLRAHIPHATFITDVIVGFPGETDEDFAESMRFVEEIGFLKVHVFSFSRREGTPAWDMPDQIDPQVKAQRSHAMQQCADAVRRQVIESLRGACGSVLLEKRVNASLFTGYTREYVPVLVRAPQHQQGDIVAVTLGEYDGERCSAELT